MPKKIVKKCIYCGDEFVTNYIIGPNQATKCRKIECRKAYMREYDQRRKHRYLSRSPPSPGKPESKVRAKVTAQPKQPKEQDAPQNRRLITCITCGVKVAVPASKVRLRTQCYICLPRQQKRRDAGVPARIPTMCKCPNCGLVHQVLMPPLPAQITPRVFCVSCEYLRGYFTEV